MFMIQAKMTTSVIIPKKTNINEGIRNVDKINLLIFYIIIYYQ